ncbi:hypothetical protein BSZ22_12665 [Bradyrhizobium canariense]|uniref:DUF2188 domain-containing protein n=1 Tax=Bradyrhizobium canariense TaxID=255045 RepID=A0A1X3FWK7_9BRAD|nr:hypothetical protein [Bradyrhizobium canariense]OSI71067.1 hypothetical protein BSZ22_12665 [Bradyrhizobium canariense]OSI79573.1 hypothetical protein BSZ23_14355 [Bradyrhizobium canariense]OSI91257.1 hypothetical protein BSZ24_18160 [Bradyrhizobium canariense]OSI91882.1 hypothetical protein BSZ25_14010 [Bradyrhizobium canariense]OSJ05691.1 hypothetical protein BSZ16_11790 [Bradyrhizobium canariense]
MANEVVGTRPDTAEGPVVFVGRDRRGNWVVRERNGTFGGLFLSRAQALKYALSENGYHPGAIIEVSNEIELDIHANPRVAANAGFGKGVRAAR